MVGERQAPATRRSTTPPCAIPPIAALRHRVHVTEDPAMSAVAPRLRPARVTVTLKDGRQDTHACESHRGDFQQPFEESELREKFRELAGDVLTPEGAAAGRAGRGPLRGVEERARADRVAAPPRPRRLKKWGDTFTAKVTRTSRKRKASPPRMRSIEQEDTEIGEKELAAGSSTATC